MTGSVQIRQALHTEASDIACVHVEAIRAAYKDIYTDAYLERLSTDRMAQNWRRNLMDPQNRIFVARIDDKAIGFACLVLMPDTSVAELSSIYMASAYIGNGIGSTLFRKCVATAKQGGFQAMKLTVLSENSPTRIFYERMQGQALPETEIEIATGGTRAKTIIYHWPDLSHVLTEGRARNRAGA